MREPTQRFSSRVENYVRYRPRYPRQLLDVLMRECGLTHNATVADIGSGTGILADLFLANGNRVFGVEPNKEMREAGERLLRSYERFTSICGTAEATTLPDQCADFITAGQAFHWFDRQHCRDEFRRILRTNGWVVLVWNDRRTDASAFSVGYERIVQTFGTDYAQVNHKRMDAAVLREFFQTDPGFTILANSQRFDLPSLTGRLLSSSYAPEPGQPRHNEMLDALKQLFDLHQKDGRISFDYDTLIYYGRLR